jgi:hypothetical protein
LNVNFELHVDRFDFCDFCRCHNSSYEFSTIAPSSAQVKDRGNIRVAHAGGGTCLAQETKLGRFVTQISFAYDLQGNRTPQIDIERFVGDTHGPTPQLDWSASLVQHHFIVLESSSLRSTVSLFSAGCRLRC